MSCTQGLGASIVTSIRGDNQVRLCKPVQLNVLHILAVQELVHLFLVGICRSHSS